MDETRERMPAGELIAAAKTLFGPTWQSLLAAEINVAVRTVRRWAAGTVQPPDLRAELAALCRRRIKELTALAERLERRQSSGDAR